MSSRDAVLNAVKAQQPAFVEAPESFVAPATGNVESLPSAFAAVLNTIGGTVHFIHALAEITDIIKATHPELIPIRTTLPELKSLEHDNSVIARPHDYENVEVAILNGHFGVAENGAVWVTDELFPERALPFITQHLALLLRKEDLVANMHEAYTRIGSEDYSYGTFIAGPSKTADIEQSLVLGAHGPRTMTVFILV